MRTPLLVAFALIAACGDTDDKDDITSVVDTPTIDTEDTDPGAPVETDLPTDSDTDPDTDPVDSDTDLPQEADADEDGFGISEDCDDTNPFTYPGAPEACDGIDSDCDPATGSFRYTAQPSFMRQVHLARRVPLLPPGEDTRVAFYADPEPTDEATFSFTGLTQPTPDEEAAFGTQAILDPDSHPVAYDVDSQGLLTAFFEVDDKGAALPGGDSWAITPTAAHPDGSWASATIDGFHDGSAWSATIDWHDNPSAEGRPARSTLTFDFGDDGTVDRVEFSTLDTEGRWTERTVDVGNDGTLDHHHQRTFDASGQLTSETILTDGTTYDVVHTYNATGALLSTSVMEGAVEQYSRTVLRDSSDRITSDIHTGALGEPRTMLMTYTGTACVATRSVDHDNDGSLDLVETRTCDASDQEVAYTLDDDQDGFVNTTRDTTYTATGREELLREYSAITGTPLLTQQRTTVYDANGDQLSLSTDNNDDGVLEVEVLTTWFAAGEPASQSQDFGGDGVLEALTSYSYDADGVLENVDVTLGTGPLLPVLTRADCD